MAKADVLKAVKADFPGAEKIEVLSEGKTQTVVSVDGAPVKYWNEGKRTE